MGFAAGYALLRHDLATLSGGTPVKVLVRTRRAATVSINVTPISGTVRTLGPSQPF